MNANEEKVDSHLQMNYVLKMLYNAVKGLNLSKVHEVAIKYYGDEPADFNDTYYTSSVLKDKNIIESFKDGLSGSEIPDTEMNRYYGGGPSVEYQYIKYTLKPNILIIYMQEISLLPKYTLSLDKKRRLVLNNKYILTTLHFDSPNFYFMEYAIKNPRKIIRINDLKKTAGKLDKRFHEILAQTIRNSELRSIFFPNVSKVSFEFRNEIRASDIQGENINERKIEKFLKGQKTIPNI